MMERYKSWQVPLTGLILEDHVTWWLGVNKDEPVSSSSDYNNNNNNNNNGLYTFSSLLQSFSRGSGNGTKVSVISNRIL